MFQAHGQYAQNTGDEREEDMLEETKRKREHAVFVRRDSKYQLMVGRCERDLTFY